jgi:3-deoxy-D-manno-octulosonate 8-phosphate phosphatase (KDO 8-P phosphatase)
LLAEFKKIKCFVFDVDGVLTNGNLLVMPGGLMARAMNIKDGYAMQLAIKKGYQVWVISGGNSEEVKSRLNNLGITEVHMKVGDKLALLNELIVLNSVSLEEIIYMGDDMPDYEAMKVVGIAACPLDACFDIKQISTYHSTNKGGEGCARDVIEKVLKLNDHWDTIDHIKAQ